MQTLTIVLSLSLFARAASPPEVPAPVEEEVGVSSGVALETSTITVTARRPLSAAEARALRAAQAGGVGAGVVGAGLMTYVLVLDLAGPFGWAASLIFLGGMTTYLSHRRLQGYQDFPPAAPAPRAPPAASDGAGKK